MRTRGNGEERMGHPLARLLYGVLLAGSLLFLTAVIVAAEQHDPAAQGAEEFPNKQLGTGVANHTDRTTSGSALVRGGNQRSRKPTQCPIKAIAWPTGSRFCLVATHRGKRGTKANTAPERL